MVRSSLRGSPYRTVIGIFGRHVAGGGVFRRTTDADPDEFRVWSPAVNSQGDFAVLLSFIDNDGLLQINRQQIISDFGTIMDTNDGFFGITFEDSLVLPVLVFRI